MTPPPLHIPEPDPPFAGVINELATESTPARPAITRPPAGLERGGRLLDDVGFGHPAPSAGRCRLRRST